MKKLTLTFEEAIAKYLEWFGVDGARGESTIHSRSAELRSAIFATALVRSRRVMALCTLRNGREAEIVGHLGTLDGDRCVLMTRTGPVVGRTATLRLYGEAPMKIKFLDMEYSDGKTSVVASGDLPSG